jgi:hypothetical protein
VKSDFPVLAQQLLDEETSIIEELIEEDIKPLAITQKPDTLLGMDYSQWKNSPQIMAMLQQIYGSSPTSRLATFIADKEYQEVLNLERLLGE